MMQKAELQKQTLARYIIETEDLAAQYAGVDVETVRQWVQNGMPTSDGAYLKPWLDTYLRTDGKPTAQDKQDTITEYPELATAKQNKPSSGQQTTPKSEVSPGSNSPESSTTPPEDIDPELKEKIKDLTGS
jgi:hypothetical protein